MKTNMGQRYLPESPNLHQEMYTEGEEAEVVTARQRRFLFLSS
jgi:hypothetical protein